MQKAGILAQPRTQHKPRTTPTPRTRRKPCELTDEEVFQLMAAFTRDTTMVTEDDALTLCRWAQAQKFGAWVLQMVLAGHLRVQVEAGQVRVGVPPGAVPGSLN